MWQKLRKSNFYLFELFIFVRFTAMYSSDIAQNVLLQDKICVQWYNQSASICANIQEDSDQSSLSLIDSHTKNNILADSAKFANYVYILQCVPMFVWSLFVGSFLDNYPGGTMIMLFVGVVGDTAMALIYLVNVKLFELSPTYLLLTSSTFFVTGGYTTFLTAFYKYTITNSSDKSRSFRFMLLDLGMALGVSFGNFLAGHMLQVRPQPDSTNPQLRTYHWNFVANLSFDTLAFVLLVVVAWLDKTRLDKRDQMDNAAKPGLLSTMFRVDNIRQIVHCIVRRRPGNARLHVYTLFGIMLCQVFVIFGIDIVVFQFAEKVYHWDSQHYTSYNSITRILSVLMMAALTAILIRCFHWTDGPLMVLAHWSSFLYYNIVGTLLYPLFYFIAISLGCLNGFSIITTRAKVSKLVEADEAGKMFSLIATIEAGLPIVASPAYANLFAATIESMPGAIYQFSAAIMTLSFVITVFEGLYFRIDHHNKAAVTAKV